jgi:predicted RNA methylase
VFAESRERNKLGWIKFPSDASIRKELFPEKVMLHPAKNNLFLIQAIIDHLYKEGDLILDPMAGTGSMMIATLSGCRVICIDCSPFCASLLRISRESILQKLPEADITVLEGDCLDFLPLPVDHVCFSPPFSDYLYKRSIDSFHTDSLSTTQEALQGFSAGNGNIGTLPEFFHVQAIEKIFKCLYQSLPPTGTMTIITRDHMEAQRRIYLTHKYIKAAERAGFVLSETFKRETPRTGLDTYNASLGLDVVDDEDISILRRPQ